MGSGVFNAVWPLAKVRGVRKVTIGLVEVSERLPQGYLACERCQKGYPRDTWLVEVSEKLRFLFTAN